MSSANIVKTLAILFLLSVVVQSQVDEFARMKKSTLQLVVQVYRHGARYPIYDAYDGKDQKAMNGELTPVGMREHFELGRKLRAEYITNRSFLSPSYSAQEIYVRSTDVTRTLMSAQCQLAGLYPYGTGPQIPAKINALSADKQKAVLDAPYKFFDSTINLALTNDPNAIPQGFQPVPIHTVEQKVDKLLLGMSYGCPNSPSWTAANKNSTDWKRITQELADPIAKFAEIMGQNSTTFDLVQLQQTMDTIITDSFQGRDIPPKLANDKDLYTKIEELLALEIHLELLLTKQQKQVSITPFFNALTGYFEKKLNNTATYKWYMHSAHDTTVSMLLVGMNLTSWECMERYHTGKLGPSEICLYKPTTYASNLIYELRQDADTKEEFVMFSVNGEYQPICDQTSKYCSYTEFKARLAQQVVPDFDVQCGFIKEYATTNSIKLAFMSIALLLLALF